jgi:LPXTG-motif cell wall-anchored protein
VREAAVARLRHVIVVALMVATIGGVGLAGDVGAQPYPPAAITAVPSVLTVGQPFTVTGVNFPANVTVTNVFNSQPVGLGSAVANAAGSYTLNATTPAVPLGTHTIVATGGGVEASTTVQVVASQAGGGAQAAPLPRTGTSSTIPLARIGIALLAAGGLVLAMTHRARRTARS